MVIGSSLIDEIIVIDCWYKLFGIGCYRFLVQVDMLGFAVSV
jgi:hypothetical protein